MDPAQQVAGPISALSGYGAAGAVAAVLLLAMLYFSKRLFDRGDKVVDTMGAKVDGLGTKLDAVAAASAQMRDAVVDELREVRHAVESLRDDFGRNGRVGDPIEREASSVRRRP